MLQIILFSIVAITLYFLCDAILRWLESRRDETFKYRQIIFFALLLSSTLLSFSAIRAILGE
jgi:predicted PurR-regulated permease PerM